MREQSRTCCASMKYWLLRKCRGRDINAVRILLLDVLGSQAGLATCVSDVAQFEALCERQHFM